MTQPQPQPMPWDMNVPRLDPTVVGQKELYDYLEQLRRGIGAVMGGASQAHQVLHDETAAVAKRVDEIADSVTKASAAADKALARTVRLVVARAPIPSLALGVEKPVTITWTPAPAAPPSAVLLMEPTGSLLGQVTASIKPDSVTATGVTVLLKAPLAVALGAGSVVVVGAVLA